MRIRNGLAWLRDGRWLTADRARAYFLFGLLVQLIYAVSLISTQMQMRDSLGGGGRPLCWDFMTFWSAARLVVTGTAVAAYDDTARAVLQHASAWMGNDIRAHYAYTYPPCFLLLSLPLGLVGYVPAMVGFLALGYALFIACIRRILRCGWGWVAIVLSPAMLLNTLIGQNGGFTASCFGAGMLFLEKRPALGGACLGFLVCKPHLAVVPPIALLAARRWRALFGYGAMAASLCLVSVLAFGLAPWVLFFAHAAQARTMIEDFPDDLPKLQSVFSDVRLLGGPVVLAYGVQVATALGSLAAVVIACARRPGAAAEIAVVVPAGFLVTPYIFDYDLTCILVPMAFLAVQAMRSGWRPWEKILLVGLYVLPLAARMFTLIAGIGVVPPMVAWLLVVCLLRIGAKAGGFAPGPLSKARL